MLHTLLRFFRRCAAFLRPHGAERSMRREIDAHLALLEEDFAARGLPPDDAHRAALRALGNVASLQDRHRDARSLVWLEDVRRDIRYAARSLARSRGFTLVAVLTMALGIGTSTSLFSLVYGVLLRPLPWPEPDRLVRLEERRGGSPGRFPWTISNATYLEWRGHTTTVEDLGGWRAASPMTMTGGGEAQQLQVAAVTPGLFGLLRAQPSLGRLFLDSDARAQPDVVLLAHGLWLRAFGGREDVVGQAIRLGEQTFTISGVMPRGFAFPDRNVDAWMPMSVVPVVDGGTRRLMIFSALARLKPGTTMTQVAAEGTARAHAAPDVGPAGLALFGSGGEPAVLAAGVVDVLTADLRPSLLLLLGAVAMLFAASTASVVLLQLARAASRRREMAVRMAIGAGVGRVARGWLIESLLLAAAGGAAGVALSIAVQRVLPGLLPPDFPRLEDVRIDGWVTAVATALSLISGLACGMVPALQARATSLAGLLAGHSAQAEGSARTRSARLRAGLMIGQVAIACALLAASGLLARSLFALTAADRGYDPHNLLTARLPLSRPATFQDKAAMLEAIRSRMAALPGVTDVAYGNALPFVTSGGFHGFNIESPRRDGTQVQMQTIVRSVSPSYFRALRIRLVAGRLPDDADLATTRGVVVVNRSFATRYLGTSPVGTIMSLGIHGKKDWEVVGVVDDMSQGGLSGRPPSRFGGIGESPQPEMFFTSAQVTQTVQEMVLVIRTAGDPVQLTPALRTAVREADASVALDSIMTMDERVRASLARPRVYVVLLTAFAACALVIAMVGLFGVLSYTTARRTREIGVRTALGARSRDVAGLVVRQALVVSTAGAAIGLALAYLLARSISSLLYGVAATDLVSFTAAPALLVAASLAACAMPARRAARVDPLIAMKSE